MRLCSALPCSTLPPPGPCQGAPPCSRSYGAAEREPCITSRVFEASRVSGAPGLGHSKGLLPDFLTSQCNPAGLSQPTALPTALPETRPSTRPFQELQLHGPAARDLPCQGLCRFLLQAALSTLPLPTASNPSLLSSPLPMGVEPTALLRCAEELLLGRAVSLHQGTLARSSPCPRSPAQISSRGIGISPLGALAMSP